MALRRDPEKLRAWRERSKPLGRGKALERVATLEAENERLRENVREAYRACAARAAERDKADSEALSLAVRMFDHQETLAGVLGMVDEDGMPPAWPLLIARVNELRTTLRARRPLAPAGTPPTQR